MKVASSWCARAAAFTGGLVDTVHNYDEASGDGVGAVLQVDFELPGTRLLHDGVDRETLNLANPVDVVDEGRERVHLLEAEGERLPRIAGKTVRRVEREAAVRSFACDVEFKLDGCDRNLTVAREAIDLIGQHPAGIELVLVLDRHDHLPMPAVADGNRNESAAEQVTVVVQIAGLPQAAGLLHAIAERIHDEDRGWHHESVCDGTRQI